MLPQSASNPTSGSLKHFQSLAVYLHHQDFHTAICVPAMLDTLSAEDDEGHFFFGPGPLVLHTESAGTYGWFWCQCCCFCCGGCIGGSGGVGVRLFSTREMPELAHSRHKPEETSPASLLLSYLWLTDPMVIPPNTPKVEAWSTASNTPVS